MEQIDLGQTIHDEEIQDELDPIEEQGQVPKNVDKLGLTQTEQIVQTSIIAISQRMQQMLMEIKELDNFTHSKFNELAKLEPSASSELAPSNNTNKRTSTDSSMNKVSEGS